MSSFRTAFRKYWYAPEAVPIYVITGGAVCGSMWYLYRLSQGPTIVWDHKNNPEPWTKIQPGTNTKLLSVNVCSNSFMSTPRLLTDRWNYFDLQQEFTNQYKRE